GVHCQESASALVLSSSTSLAAVIVVETVSKEIGSDLRPDTRERSRGWRRGQERLFPTELARGIVWKTWLAERFCRLTQTGDLTVEPHANPYSLAQLSHMILRLAASDNGSLKNRSEASGYFASACG